MEVASIAGGPFLPHPPWRKSLGLLSDASLVHRQTPPLCYDAPSVQIFAQDQVPLPSQMALALAGVDFHETLLLLRSEFNISQRQKFHST